MSGPRAVAASGSLTHIIDARGSLCPIPTVKASLALDQAQSGDVLELLSDDPVTRRDLPRWCREQGHALLRVDEEGDVFRFHIQKS